MVENKQNLLSQLNTLQGDIEEKRTRLTKIKTDMGTAKYDVRLAEQTEKAKRLEEQREALNSEFRSLSLQADARAKLDLKRAEIRSKNGEIHSTSVVPLSYWSCPDMG
jgi:DNA repair protein RAD50